MFFEKFLNIMKCFGIYLCMKLNVCPKNQDLKVISLNNIDYKLKLRLYEIGFYPTAKIKVLNISHLKQTMLIQVLDSCFAIKSHIAECIEVEYD